jgi:hypothetical protein
MLPVLFLGNRGVLSKAWLPYAEVWLFRFLVTIVLSCSQLDLARAILLASKNGAHIINISGGQLTPSASPNLFCPSD